MKTLNKKFFNKLSIFFSALLVFSPLSIFAGDVALEPCPIDGEHMDPSVMGGGSGGGHPRCTYYESNGVQMVRCCDARSMIIGSGSGDLDASSVLCQGIPGMIPADIDPKTSTVAYDQMLCVLSFDFNACFAWAGSPFVCLEWY